MVLSKGHDRKSFDFSSTGPLIPVRNTMLRSIVLDNSRVVPSVEMLRAIPSKESWILSCLLKITYPHEVQRLQDD